MKKMVHYLVLPPVGWGFMLVNCSESSRTCVITDGGYLLSCRRKTLDTLGFLKPCVRHFSGNWTWIISHIDYDHYSLVAELVKKGLLPKPGEVVVPGVYSQQACRETLAEYHKLACILATIPGAPLPSFSDLVEIIGRARQRGKVYGVFQGGRLYFNELVYHVIWPSKLETAKQCEKLQDEIEKKLDEALEKCRRMRGEACDKALKRAEQEGNEVKRAIEPSRIVESLNLGQELDKGGEVETGFQAGEPRLEEPSYLENPPLGTYSDIYAQAAEKFNDLELLKLHMNVINAHSLAYAIEFKSPLYRSVKVWLCDFPKLNHSGSVQLYRYLAHHPSESLLLYPADLDGDALEQAIKYYSSHKQSVIIEVAAHHGNAYSASLQHITPYVVLISRCPDHATPKMRENFVYWKRFLNLPMSACVLTGHSYGLMIRIY